MFTSPLSLFFIYFLIFSFILWVSWKGEKFMSRKISFVAIVRRPWWTLNYLDAGIISFRQSQFYEFPSLLSRNFHWKKFDFSTNEFSTAFSDDFPCTGLRRRQGKFAEGLNNNHALLIYRFILIAINKSGLWLVRCFNQISRYNWLKCISILILISCSLMFSSTSRK